MRRAEFELESHIRLRPTTTGRTVQSLRTRHTHLADPRLHSLALRPPPRACTRPKHFERHSPLSPRRPSHRHCQHQHQPPHLLPRPTLLSWRTMPPSSAFVRRCPRSGASSGRISSAPTSTRPTSNRSGGQTTTNSMLRLRLLLHLLLLLPLVVVVMLPLSHLRPSSTPGCRRTRVQPIACGSTSASPAAPRDEGSTSC